MSSGGACAFCRKRGVNARTGKMLMTADGEIMAHYYCTLFSPKVVSAESCLKYVFGGFDIETVKQEIRRANKLKCSHCDKNGASVGCDIRRCNKSYHYECVEDADGKCIEDRKKQMYIALCAQHKEQAMVGNSNQLNDDSDTSDQSSTFEDLHGKTGQKSKEKNREMKHGKTNTGRITQQTQRLARRSYNVVKRCKKLNNRQFKLTEKKKKTEYSTGVIQDAKRRKQSQTVLGNDSAITQKTEDNEETPGTSASARQGMPISDCDTDDSDLPVFDGCSLSQKSQSSQKYANKSILSQSSEQTKEVLYPSPHACTSRSSSESSDSLLSPKQPGIFFFNGIPEKNRKHNTERNTDPQKEEMDEEDTITGNTVVTEATPSFDHPVLDTDSEARPAANGPDHTVISRASPVMKQCSDEQSVRSSTKETISSTSIIEKADKTRIMSRLRRRLITQPPNTTNTNDRSHMSSLDEATSPDHYLDGLATQSIGYCNESTAQSIGSVSGTERQTIQPIHSSYSEDMYAAQPVSSFNGEGIPVTEPAHAEPMGYIKYNRSMDEKSVFVPKMNTDFAEQLRRQLKFLNEQSPKIPNTQVTSETRPSVSPLAQRVHVEQPATSPFGIDDSSFADIPQAFKIDTNPTSVGSLISPDVSAPETDKEIRRSQFVSPEKISEMSAKLVTGSLSKRFNFSNIRMQIQSPIRSAKNSLSLSRDDQATCESSPRPGPSSEATQKYFNEVDEKQRSSGPTGLKQSDEHCLGYSRLEHKIDSLVQGQKRLMSLLEAQQSKFNLLLESMMTTPGNSIDKSCPSPPLSTSSLPGIQSLCDHNYTAKQPPH